MDQDQWNLLYRVASWTSWRSDPALKRGEVLVVIHEGARCVYFLTLFLYYLLSKSLMYLVLMRIFKYICFYSLSSCAWRGVLCSTRGSDEFTGRDSAYSDVRFIIHEKDKSAAPGPHHSSDFPMAAFAAAVMSSTYIDSRT